MRARSYQKEARDAVLAAWGVIPGSEDTFRSVLVNLPTASGKTIISGLIIEEVKDRGRCLFIADTDELCDQPLRKFSKLFGFRPGLEKAASKASRHADIVIGSAQTLVREKRISRFPRDHFGYIFVDEAHRGSDRNKKITDYFSEAKVCGQTATAFRRKLADLSDYYESVAYEKGLFDLADEGFLSTIKVLTLPINIDISKVHQTASPDGPDYDKSELDTTIAPFYEEVARQIKKHAANRQIIAFLPLIKSSQEFVTILRAFDINAHHVDGKSPNREFLLEAFARGEFQLLSNSSLLTTGWDCPRVDCLLNLSPTRSVGLFRQKVGRITRLEHGLIDDLPDEDQAEERKQRIAQSAKPDALILDVLWQVDRFGLVGPADLIAANEQERLALQIKISKARDARDLQAVSAEVQEEREQKLKKEAEEQAARRRGVVGVVVDFIAAVLHGRKLLDYEPTMRWEAQPITDKQRAWCNKNGIDPTSVKDRGHVSALMSLLFMRKRNGLASWRVVKALQDKGVAGSINFTDQAGYEELKGDYPFPFGKHIGVPLKYVPAGYLEYIGKQEWIQQWPVIYHWINRKVLSENGCLCIGSYKAPNCPVHPRADQFFDCLPEVKS